MGITASHQLLSTQTKENRQFQYIFQKLTSFELIGQCQVDTLLRSDKVTVNANSQILIH